MERERRMEQMALYEFDREDAFRLANQLMGNKYKRNNQLIFDSCPYCHGGKGNKDRGTFAIDLTTGMFNCKRSSCGAKGNMITLARDFNFSLTDDVDRYFNSGNYREKRFKEFKGYAHKEPKDRAVAYMGQRGISEAVTTSYGITIKKDTDNILAFPFLNTNGDLTFIKYRNLDFVKGKGSKEWCESDCKPILFGMDHCNPDDGALVMTEGQIDSLSLTEAGVKNAVSVPMGMNGFTWIPYCWDFLSRFDTLIVFGDMEKGRMTLLDTMQKRFHGKVLAVQEKDYRGCKDANEILQKHGKDALVAAVKNAKPCMIRYILEVADIEDVDLNKLKKIPTGIGKIDKLLSGGIHEGELCILTGKAGNGKSTFMSQIIANALEDGHSVFAYSGELTDFYFKNWIYQQIAGREAMQSIKDIINEWVRGRFYLFDNSAVLDEMPDLAALTEKAICMYGVDFVCIDNLMMAMDYGAENDFYHRQSLFIGKMARISKTYKIPILLISHPKKNYDSDTDGISGSADIGNRADIVMHYNIPAQKDMPAPDHSMRALHITKNRLTGNLTRKNKPIELFYDMESKRISDEKDFKWTYKCFSEDSMGFLPLPAELLNDIPF